MALLSAAAELVTPTRAPTLAELTERIGQDMPLGGEVVRKTVHNMTYHGKLRIVRTRRVAYRNRPVAEYAPVDPAEEGASGDGFVDLAAAWAGVPVTSTTTRTISKD